MEPNWFIGLPIAPDRWIRAVPAPPAGIERFHSADLHATVAFLGPVDEARAKLAFEALALALPVMDVSLGAVVALGNPARYSALSALLDEGRVVVEAAMGPARERAWAAAGSERDGRPPKAHVTLARPSRKAGARERDAGLAWAGSLSLAAARVRIDRVALYTWSDARGARGAPQFRVVTDRALSVR